MFELNLFKEYIYYPNNRLHIISIKIKNFTLLCYIIMLPFILVDTIIMQGIILLYMSIHNYKACSTRLEVFLKIFYFFNLLLALNLFNISYNKDFVFVLRYEIKILVYIRQSIRCIINTYILYVKLENSIIRIYFILMNYYVLHKLILSTTKIDNILRCNIKILSLYIRRSYILNELGFIVLFSYHFTYLFEEEVKILMISYFLMNYCIDSEYYLLNKLNSAMKLIYLRIRKTKHRTLLKNQVVFFRDLQVSQNKYWLI